MTRNCTPSKGEIPSVAGGWIFPCLGEAATSRACFVPASHAIRSVQTDGAYRHPGCAPDRRLQSARRVLLRVCFWTVSSGGGRFPGPRPQYFRCRYGTLPRDRSGTWNASRSSDFDGEVSKHEENRACAASSLGGSGGGRSQATGRKRLEARGG